MTHVYECGFFDTWGNVENIEPPQIKTYFIVIREQLYYQVSIFQLENKLKVDLFRTQIGNYCDMALRIIG